MYKSSNEEEGEMPRVTTAALLRSAVARSCGVAALNVISLEHAEGIVGGAERAAAPVILQISANTVHFHGEKPAPLVHACIALAEAAAVPIAVHLDHATSPALCAEAIALGCSSVMFDGSNLEFSANVAATADVATAAHRAGAFVEAELGKVGGKDGVHDPGARTDPAEAVHFVANTGVDALAVAVGTSHAMVEKRAELDFTLLERLRAAVPVPLVLHGSSGVAPDDLIRAVRAGIAKVNVGTELNVVFTRALRATLVASDTADPRPALAAGRQAVSERTAELVALINQASR